MIFLQWNWRNKPRDEAYLSEQIEAPKIQFHNEHILGITYLSQFSGLPIMNQWIIACVSRGAGVGPVYHIFPYLPIDHDR